jgi:DNA helicase MCM8
MIRLSEARAKAELREEVTSGDAEDIVEIMKHSLFESYKDEVGNIDLQRSQHGTGMSKRGEPKRFISELSRVAYEQGNNRFSQEEMYAIATVCDGMLMG